MIEKPKSNRYGIAVTNENVPVTDPINLRGSFEHCADIAAEAGYDAIELQVRTPLELDVAGIRKICRERHLAVSSFALGMELSMNKMKSFIVDDCAERRRSINRFLEYIDVSTELDCGVLFARFRGDIPDFSKYDIYYRRFFEAMEEICAAAEKKNVPIYLECINIYITNWLNTVKDNTDFVKALKSPALKVHIDTHHMNIDERDISGAVDYCRDYLGYVHVAESNRSYCGSGNFDFLSFMRKVMSTGYDGYYTVENKPLPDQKQSAAISLNYLKNLEAAIRSLPEW
ncbi:MAG: sugar phosphate isomerase/epimerase family protein [Christensenellales bacterium]